MKTTVRTRVALAAALGVDRGTLRRYLARGMPTCADGGFDVDACRAWIEARGNRPGSVWRTRKLRAAALRAEFSLALARGDLIPVAAVEREQVRWVDELVTALEALPAKLTPLLVAARGNAETEQVLRTYTAALRTQLAAQVLREVVA